MAIIEKEGFKFTDGLEGRYIVVESSRITDYIEYINKNKIKAAFLSNLYYFANEIDFLQECNFLEKINITSSSIENYDGLSYLQSLKDLILDESKGKVDLTYHTALKRLSIYHSKNIIGMEQLKGLKELSIWNYKPKSRDLSEISGFNSIKELEIIQSNINSLNGCGNLLNLERLKFAYLSQFRYIDELEKIKKSLRILDFDCCKKIENHEYVMCLNNLEKLSYYKCGNIKTINFISNMPNLKDFVFMGTNVVDGNLKACAGLEYVAFTNKRHFSHKMSDFRN